MSAEFCQTFARVRPSPKGGKTILSIEENVISVDDQWCAFDGVFHSNISQEEIFDQVGKRIVEGALEGVNGTIFAYGQTGSGKTFTMTGPIAENAEAKEELKGLIPRSVDYLFNCLENMKEEKEESFESKVNISYVEIYGERITDLLSDEGNFVYIRSDKKTQLEGATKAIVTQPSEALHLLHEGLIRRRVAETAMNENSSRSHSVFIIEIEVSETLRGISSTRQARLCLVDLAGSERQEHANSAGDRLKEGCSINKSLTSLTRVIRQLAKGGQGHVSFRDSKLTLLLKDSLGGDSRTAVVVALHGGSEQKRETLSSLAFAENVKKVKNVTTAHKTVTGATVAALQQRVSELEQTLEKEQEEKRQERKEAARLRAQLEEQIEDLSTRTVKATPAKKKRRMTQHDHALISEIQGRLFDDDDPVCQDPDEMEKENDSCESLRDQLKKKEQEYSDVTSENADLKAKLKKMEENIAELHSSINILRANQKEAETKLTSRCELLKTLKEENAELVDRVQEAEQKTETLQKTIGEVRGLLHEANNQITALEKNKKKLDKEIEVNLSSQRATEEIVQQLREELVEKETALRESEAERAKTSDELVKLVEAKTTRSRVSAMQKLKDENEELKKQLNDYKKELSRLRGGGR